jgi:hypothetical protein
MEVSESVKKLMQEFTNGVRYGSESKDLQLYADFITSNIEGVLENTFPYFNKYAAKTSKKELVKYFIQCNKSEDPAFHQIATELLKCSKKLKMPEHFKKLIEFEWLIFSTEISAEEVFESQEINIELDFSQIKAIQANATLSFVALPFEISKLGKKFERGAENLYAIYRNKNNKVTYFKISMLEYLILNSLLTDGVKKTFQSENYKNIDAKYKSSFVNRLAIWHNQNMIKINF